jgi:phosphoribosylformylglycinamidine (FGAM) synthase-like enzyme
VGGSVAAELLGHKAPLPTLSYSAERSAVAIVHDALAREVLLSCRAVSDGGMLTAIARLAIDAHVNGRNLGAEIDFGNPFCETGGFVCEVSDDSSIDLTGALRIGTTIDRSELVVNGTHFSVARLYEAWSQPLMEVYP